MQKDLADAFLLPRALAHTCTAPLPPAPLPQLAEWLVKKKKKGNFYYSALIDTFSHYSS